MRLPVTVGILMAILFMVGCDKGVASFSSKAKTKKEDCVAPSNPYNDGGGHDAGFNWALENGEACNGNADSFNEGCEEYYRQLNQYNECLNNK